MNYIYIYIYTTFPQHHFKHFFAYIKTRLVYYYLYGDDDLRDVFYVVHIITHITYVSIMIELPTPTQSFPLRETFILYYSHVSFKPFTRYVPSPTLKYKTIVCVFFLRTSRFTKDHKKNKITYFFNYDLCMYNIW